MVTSSRPISIMSIQWLVVVAGASVIYFVGLAVYNIYFHPLAGFKGPKLWAAFRTPFLASMLRGYLPTDVKKLHDKYGTVVRIAPDELSFIDATSWQEIYSTKPGQNLLIRPTIWKRKVFEADNLITASETTHARLRKAMAPAFSDKAQRGYEDLLQEHVDTFIQRIRGFLDTAAQKHHQKSVDVDLLEWVSYATFDILGDVAFGESFGCLKYGKFHPSIMLVQQYRAALFQVAIGFYPLIEKFLSLLAPKSAKDAVRNLVLMTRERVGRRLAKGSEARPDCFAHLVTDQKTGGFAGLSNLEVETNCILLLIAGSETVTSGLCATINALLFHPDALQRLTSEIRKTFNSEQEITSMATARIPYLNAIIQEALRTSPPVPDGLRREIPPGGYEISGQWIPEKSVVSVSQLAASTSATNFSSPQEFLPERWLNPNDPEFAADKRSACQPFSVGPHNCMGQTLAWAQMRMILVKLLWNFEIKATPDTVQWHQQKIYWAWDKGPMMAKITRA